MDGLDMMSIDEAEELAASENTEATEKPTEETPKGPDMSELMAKVNALENALKLSETARLEAQQAALSGQPAPIPPEETPLSEDELSQLMQTDAVAAVRYMQERAIKEAEKHLERRLAGLSTGGISAAQAQAKAKYPVEFQIFEQEISAAIGQLNAQGREMLANPANWDQLVGYIRGQPGNFERYIEHHNKTAAESAAAAAREAAVKSSGFSASSNRQVNPPSTDDSGLDSIQLQIANELGISPADYKTWSKK